MGKDITDVEFTEVGEQKDEQEQIPELKGVDPVRLSEAFAAVDELFTKMEIKRIEGYIVLTHLVCQTALDFKRTKEDMLDVLGEVYELLATNGVEADKIKTPKF